MSEPQRLQQVTSIDDLRSLAERRVPRAFFQYMDHGSYSQPTLRANRLDLEEISLRQRVAIDVSVRSLKTTMIGESVEYPLAVAPIGLLGMMHRNGANGSKIFELASGPVEIAFEPLPGARLGGLLAPPQARVALRFSSTVTAG